MPGHLLDPLRDPTQPSVLFCGAGLSAGVVPTANELYELEHERIERELRIAGAIDHAPISTLPKPERLYAWAEAVIDHLRGNGEPLPKLRFAESLGLLHDARWWGRAEIDFRGAAPRHRVIARFAKEGLWHSVWSFNWDCILEHAFEQVGLPEGPPRFRSPWRKNHYVTHLHKDHFPLSKEVQSINIHKPHGCVRGLHMARTAQGDGSDAAADLSGRFMVGQKELTDRDGDSHTHAQDQVFSDALRDGVRAAFNLVVGWRMAEQSLRREIQQAVGHPGTRVAVVDLEFNDHHKAICQAAGQQPVDAAYFAVTTLDCPDRDDVFLWQQALFTLEQLEAANQGSPVLDADGTNWRAAAACCSDGFFVGWADEFLPAWTRLCWSAGLLQASAMPSHRIDLERRDEYVPLNYRDIERADLRTAIALLNALPALGEGFDAKDFPGGLFHLQSSTLVVPLPHWGELNDLRALRPLIDALRGRLGFVQQVAVWPIGPALSPSGHGERLLQRLADIMPVLAFANRGAKSSRIDLISDIQEVTHGSS